MITRVDSDIYTIDAATRPVRTGGGSQHGIYVMVQRVLASQDLVAPRVFDIACGTGSLVPLVHTQCGSLEGSGWFKYGTYPTNIAFHTVDGDTGRVGVSDHSFHVTLSFGTGEHLENPLQFFRERVRLANAEGQIAITTPNLLSYISMLSLVVRNHFIAFGLD